MCILINKHHSCHFWVGKKYYPAHPTCNTLFPGLSSSWTMLTLWKKKNNKGNYHLFHKTHANIYIYTNGTFYLNKNGRAKNW